MNSILTYIREYFRDEWNPILFGTTALFLALAFTLNYSFDFETSITAKYSNPPQQLLFYFFFYGIPYAFSIVTYALTTKNTTPLQQKGFYFLATFSIILISIYVTLHNVPAFIVRNYSSLLGEVPGAYHWYFARYASNLLPGIAIIIPIGVYWFTKDRETSRFYGFSSSGISLRTYAAIVLSLMPIVFVASLTSDFQLAYPRYKFGLPGGTDALETNVLVGVFEICYGIDFVVVEFLFRGFLVMAFVRYLGAGAVLPMVVVYAFIHFQKPLGEALGSIAGGLVLGIISLRTKSIYGGITLHLGVAYMMEIAGTVHLLLR